MKIGLTQGTVDLQEQDVIARVARLGVTAYEPYIGTEADEYYHWSERDLAAFVSGAEELAVATPSVALGLFNNDSRLIEKAGLAYASDITCRTLRFTAAIGGSVMLLCTFIESEPDTPEKIRNLVSVVHDIEPHARGLGVKIALESPLAAGELVQLVDTIDSDIVGVYYDLGNAVALGFDPAEEIEILGQRIMSVHIKDSSDTLGGLHLGEGKLNLGAAIGALERIDYRGWLMLETPNGGDDVIRRDIEAVARLL